MVPDARTVYMVVHEGRVAVGEGTDHAGAPADLAHDALERIVGPDAPPVLLGKGVVGQGLRALPT
jgi:hypothetical protein